MKRLVFFSFPLMLFACSNLAEKKKSFIQMERLDAQVKLGRLLFFDPNLSATTTISCASCHNPKNAFADTVSLSKGVFGRKSFRNTPSIVHIKQAKHFFYDGAVPTLERQVLVPLLDHNEMNASLKQVMMRLKKNPVYVFLARKAFGKSIDAYVLTRSIAAFERTLMKRTSKFDAFNAGNTSVFSTAEKRGWKLFNEKLNCASCHPAPNFTTHEFADNGLFAIDMLDEGRYRITGRNSDKGQFKIPSLRNCGVTAPYMHNGSINSLKKVIESYLTGSEKQLNHPDFQEKIKITTSDKHALYLFLLTLTDSVYREK